jgi:hypothetical protein
MNDKINTQREITMGAGEANLKAIILAVPIVLLFITPYFIIWGENVNLSLLSMPGYKTLKILTYLIIGAILHEFIHGVFWAIYLKNGFRSIRFGIMWKYLTPYCHSKEPMKLKHYRLGAIMPCIILGIIPAAISLFLGDIGLLAFGVFFTVAAGGDILMIWLLREKNKNILVQDHPDKIGCILLN